MGNTHRASVEGSTDAQEPFDRRRRAALPPEEPDWLDDLFADADPASPGDVGTTGQGVDGETPEEPPRHPPPSLWTGRESSDGKHRRKRAVRPQTLSVRQLARQRKHLPVVRYPKDVDRPKTRGDCANVPRPCPYVSCKWHLYLDVQPNGSIRLNFPDLEPHELPPEASCANDVADSGAATLERVAEYLNLTRERVRQIEERLIPKVGAMGPHLRDLIAEPDEHLQPRRTRHDD